MNEKDTREQKIFGARNPTHIRKATPTKAFGPRSIDPKNIVMIPDEDTQENSVFEPTNEEAPEGGIPAQTEWLSPEKKFIHMTEEQKDQAWSLEFKDQQKKHEFIKKTSNIKIQKLEQDNQALKQHNENLRQQMMLLQQNNLSSQEGVALQQRQVIEKEAKITQLTQEDTAQKEQLKEKAEHITQLTKIAKEKKGEHKKVQQELAKAQKINTAKDTAHKKLEQKFNILKLKNEGARGVALTTSIHFDPTLEYVKQRNFAFFLAGCAFFLIVVLFFILLFTR